MGWKDSLEREMATHSSTLPEKFHGQRSLVDYTPWGRKKSDTTATEHTHMQVLLFCRSVVSDSLQPHGLQ